ncbi:uncharacterized protein LOC141649817 [Silene latifolia]|uniref:uncharacterized protein LOC141649817 n=1 Tax=Silene latifolia TaxID=37657 RepID=UPI003D77CBF2
MISILADKGPQRDLSFEKGPKDYRSRQFSSTWFTRVLSNGEKCDRDWLVYSKELDKVFCFCCKIFRKGAARGQLANEGFGHWSHLSDRLKEHENGVEHITNMTAWYDLRERVKKNKTIDKVAKKKMKKEKDHWKNLLQRVIYVVEFLAKHNLPFRGKKQRLYQKNNGNFLGLIEMLAKFDPIIQEHVLHITNDKIHFHYLGHNIQNELILLIASIIKAEIIKNVKEAKYFSVILDCTPDISHQEQMSLILRYVDVSSNSICVQESFLGFLNVDDTTGQGLFNVLLNELKSLDLDVDNVRGQSYDNGSNMKGKHQGVQKKLLDINCRAFFTPCGSHSLNLTLCDIANSCGKAKDFFGVIQRIYTIFANSTKRWKILLENVPDLTLKPLSSTRWESRVESVKAIRFQIAEIREALLQVGETDNDSKIRSEAKSLAKNELGDFEFLVALVIWYEILFRVNYVSKSLQSHNMVLDIAIEDIRKLILFFEEYRESGFLDALSVAKNIAIELNVDPIFRKRRVIRRKKHFDENQASSSDEVPQTTEESFRVNYFLYIVDQAIGSLDKRFEQYQEFQNIFGFLFTSSHLHSLDNETLNSKCNNLQKALTNGEQFDINGNDLYMELKLLKDILHDKEMKANDILDFLKLKCYFPNAFIVYRILLTIPMTVASAERSFSKLKLLKSYLRSTMLQERLNGLALIAIEKDLLKKVDYEHLIDIFSSRKARRRLLFK